MKKAIFRPIYNRTKRLTKNGTASIVIECYLDRKRKYLKTGIKIAPDQWNNKRSVIRNNHPDSVRLNRRIRQQIEALEKFEFKQVQENNTFSLDEIDGYIINLEEEGAKIKALSSSFFEFCNKALSENFSVTKSTKRQHKESLSKVEKYFPNLKFRDINYNMVKKLDDSLRIEKLHINTIAKHHKVFKTYINLAIKQDLLKQEDYPYKSFKVKKQSTKREFLTNDEVEKIANLKFTERTKHIEHVRDMFIFSCYTGLRYSDVQKITNRNIKLEGKDYYIEIQMHKTKDFIKLPISLLFNGKAVDVINKYKSEYPEEYIFPRLSNQKANVKLKIVSMIAQIDKNLTFHISRHTFGTNLAAATSDQFVIKELMGHSDIKTSMIYIHTSQEQIKNKLKNTKWDNF